jgi:hypothetical protein
MKKMLPILLAGSTLLYAQSGLAAIKCWTNSEGYRECGNAVPPEYAQQETRTLNKRGLTTDIQSRAKSREEILEEKRIAEELMLKENEEKRNREEQAIRDGVLLATFLSPEEIVSARDRKIAVFDGYLELSLISIGNLTERLEEEQRKVAGLERSGQTVPDTTLEQIRSLRNQISVKEAFIRQKEGEKAQLRKKYDDDYKRFIELKGGKR